LQELPTPDRLPARLFRREDGLTVVCQQVKATPVVVADVWARAGTASEPDTWPGVAHFLEHAIFKGSDRLGPGAFDRAVERRGGSSNAATSHDYAHFFIATAAADFADTLPYLSELLLRPAIDDREFDRERLVVLEELRQARDFPDGVAFDVLMETAYSKHPYRRPVLGNETSLLRLSPENMRCFHSDRYQPQNLVVAVVGNIDPERARDRVDECFRHFRDPQPCPAVAIEPEAVPTQIRRRGLSLPRLEGARLNLAWVGPGIDRIADAYALDVLAVVLAEGRSSQLVRDLREARQWVHDIGSGFSLQKDSSLLTVSAILEADFIDAVEQQICDRIAQLHAKPISATELDRAKRLLCNDYAFSTETPSQIAGLYGYYQMLHRAETAVAYPHRIAALTPEDIQKAARQYLSVDSYAVVAAVSDGDRSFQ